MKDEENVYQKCPEFSNDMFYIRKVAFTDGEDLLKVYSDEKSIPIFNRDNCFGDDFIYKTLERVNQEIAFWLFQYDQKGFVRWSIENQKREVIGTIELFHRDSVDYYTDCGLLRLDLRSDYETETSIKSILSLIVEPSFKLFNCSKIAIKIPEIATDRKKAFEDYGFSARPEKLVGHDGTEYSDYYEKIKQ